MSVNDAMMAVLEKLSTAASASGFPMFASLRAATAATPCFIWDAAIQRVPIMPNGQWANGKPYWQIELTVTMISDSLDDCFGMLQTLHEEMDTGPYSVTIGTKTFKLTAEQFGPFSTEAATPDDGKQDAERSITGSITIHVTEQ